MENPPKSSIGRRLAGWSVFILLGALAGVFAGRGPTQYSHMLRDLDPDPVVAGASFFLGTTVWFVFRPGVESVPNVTHSPRLFVNGKANYHRKLLVTSFLTTGPDGVAVEVMTEPKEYTFFPGRTLDTYPPGVTEVPASIHRGIQRDLKFEAGDELKMRLMGTLVTVDGPVAVDVSQRFRIERVPWIY